MGKSRPNRVGLFRVAVILASGGFLAACAVDPIEPTAASAGSAEPAPVSTANHTMATDIAGPVDLGSESATVPMTEIAGPIQDAWGAVHTANARRHSLASNHRQPSVIASASHRKSPRQVTARQAPPARKHAKVSAETRASGPKT